MAGITAPYPEAPKNLEQAARGAGMGPNSPAFLIPLALVKSLVEKVIGEPVNYR